MTQEQWILIGIIIVAFLTWRHMHKKSSEFKATGPAVVGKFEAVSDDKGWFNSRLGGFYGKVAK